LLEVVEPGDARLHRFRGPGRGRGSGWRWAVLTQLPSNTCQASKHLGDGPL